MFNKIKNKNSDDDNGNLPQPSFWLTAAASVVNPYLLFGSNEYIWPRGYPIDWVKEREFPRIVNYNNDDNTPHKIDVIQIMQDIDPDVDALWRLQYGVDNFQWLPMKVLENTIIGIHPSNMAPFNAQATLLSQRALSFAYLP